MSRPRIFIDGEAGTTGLQIRTRLEGRDDLQLVHIDPERRKDDAERKRILNDVDLAILCLPDDAARAAVALVDNPTTRILDASTAYRVHPDWTYGFPELSPGQADRIAASARVSNPGCYPTGALGLLRPLIDAGLVPTDFPVTIQAISGYSGGGRGMIEAYELTGPGASAAAHKMYALELSHKHVREIQAHAHLDFKPLFTPAVGRFRQGMLVQIPLHLRTLPGDVSGRAIHQALVAHYAGTHHVRVMPLDPRPVNDLEPEALNDTNDLELFVFENAAERQVLLVARLDNLGKGASGAAVQNLELMLGLEPRRA
ncbi:N-acetyl-gamma-glutamyl-phosphate reductase [Isosphaeraceae bacterium EP7]